MPANTSEQLVAEKLTYTYTADGKTVAELDPNEKKPAVWLRSNWFNSPGAVRDVAHALKLAADRLARIGELRVRGMNGEEGDAQEEVATGDISVRNPDCA